MNILPRFLYLFQCLPLFLPKLFFTTLDKLITGFLWGNKLPRINKVMLQRHRTQGGLSLPNFRFYYWAANIQKIMYWIKFPQINWCLIEANSCPSCSLVSLVTSSLPLSPRQYSSSHIVITTLKILSQFRKRFNLSAASSLTPIHNSHLFLPSRLDHAFNLWLKNGIINIGQLYIGGVFGSSGDVFV